MYRTRSEQNSPSMAFCATVIGNWEESSRTESAQKRPGWALALRPDLTTTTTGPYRG